MGKSDFAILISVLSLAWGVGWSVYTWWHQPRTQKQRVRASIRLDDKHNKPFLAAEIYNCGAIPVYLKSVVIHWKPLLDRHANLPLETDPLQHKLLDGKGTIYFQATKTWTRKEPLDPHASCTFYLFDADLDLMRKLIGLTPDQVWLSVMSNGQELSRITGSTLMNELVGLTHLWESPTMRTA
jgi:hypothetical protein